ncbi:Ribosomal protein S24/S35, mitochondrial, conserved domain [Dillenia turbinata]|uniref:Ribosomal protein S24/S35, mitochondrial, conserved domain n=1 Tax=Dillenia turbinata TaxID=194707 RepID=A0AAN8V0R4_9MAGN
MKRSLVKCASSLYRAKFLSPSIKSYPNPNPVANPTAALVSRYNSPSWKQRFFSSEDDSSSKQATEAPPPSSETQTQSETGDKASLLQSEEKQLPLDVQDVSNKEFKEKIEKYFKGDEEALPDIFEAILKRKLVGKHEETDDELMEELQFQPLDDVKDQEFESDFDELYETDEEIDDLYNARQIVERRMMKDEYFNMDDKKWDEMIKEATEKGFLKDTKECEAILEDMLSWDKLLPDEIKQKVEAKFNELGDMCERGELEPEEAYKLFKEYEDQMVLECAEIMEAEGPPQFDEMTVPDKKDKDDPPGEGPILRWKTRVVFAPGGDAWHPKNRKVKLSVTVKELGLSKHQFRRLRELVGKRYNSGKDELTITSERFEHREENRKDCLRTLFNLIEEAGKANKMVEEARTSYVKDRLRANPDFMKRLRAKTMRLQASKPAPM